MRKQAEDLVPLKETFDQLIADYEAQQEAEAAAASPADDADELEAALLEAAADEEVATLEDDTVEPISFENNIEFLVLDPTRTDGRTDGRSDGRTVGRSDGRTVGRTIGRTVRRTDGRRCYYVLFVF